MSDQNVRFVSALVKLGLPMEDYRNHPAFQALPGTVGDPLWGHLQDPPYQLTVFEFGAIKNVSCPTLSQPLQAGKCLSYPPPTDTF